MVQLVEAGYIETGHETEAPVSASVDAVYDVTQQLGNDYKLNVICGSKLWNFHHFI